MQRCCHPASRRTAYGLLFYTDHTNFPIFVLLLGNYSFRTDSWGFYSLPFEVFADRSLSNMFFGTQLGYCNQELGVFAVEFGLVVFPVFFQMNWRDTIVKNFSRKSWGTRVRFLRFENNDRSKPSRVKMCFCSWLQVSFFSRCSRREFVWNSNTCTNSAEFSASLVWNEY